MNKAKELRHVPWKGSQYDEGFREGLRFLVLGESHYGDDLGPEMTRHWLGQHVDGKIRGRTWMGCEKLLAFCRDTADTNSSIWQRVAFANFVQVCMTDRSVRPQDADWQIGTDAFPKLLDHLRPDVVLTLGAMTWEWLPWKGPGMYQNHEKLRTRENQWGVAYPRPDGGICIAGYVNHPASPGWRAETWYPHVERLLRAAKELLAPRLFRPGTRTGSSQSSRT